MSCTRFFAASLVVFGALTAAEAADDETAEAAEAPSPHEAYEQAVRDAGVEYLLTVRRARSEYIDALDTAVRDATLAGDLERALELLAEKEIAESHAAVIPNPLESTPDEEAERRRLRLDPAPPVPLSVEMLTARPWYVFHRTPPGTSRIVKVIQLQPDGSVVFLEGAGASDWDDKQPTWKYEEGHLVLTTSSGAILARFPARVTTILHSQEEDPHRFFWIQQEIHDPFGSAASSIGN